MLWLAYLERRRGKRGHQGLGFAIGVARQCNTRVKIYRKYAARTTTIFVVNIKNTTTTSSGGISIITIIILLCGSRRQEGINNYYCFLRLRTRARFYVIIDSRLKRPRDQSILIRRYYMLLVIVSRGAKSPLGHRRNSRTCSIAVSTRESPDRMKFEPHDSQMLLFRLHIDFATTCLVVDRWSLLEFFFFNEYINSNSNAAAQSYRLGIIPLLQEQIRFPYNYVPIFTI